MEYIELLIIGAQWDYVGNILSRIRSATEASLTKRWYVICPIVLYVESVYLGFAVFFFCY